jgi:hypothetical protein
LEEKWNAIASESQEQRKKHSEIMEATLFANIDCLVTAATVFVVSIVVGNVISNITGWVTKFQSGFARIGRIGGETCACQFRKHSVKGLSLFHFALVINDLRNGRGSQLKIGGATGILSETVILQNAIDGVESVVGRP